MTAAVGKQLNALLPTSLIVDDSVMNQTATIIVSLL
jgi:hypothetical protein